MSRPLSPQLRFLLRGIAWLPVLLAVWWMAARYPLLAWERVSTDILLNAVPGAPLATGVNVRDDGVWLVQAPARVAGQVRNIRVELPQRLPVQLTVGFPLFWAAVLAAGATRRLWRVLAWGSAALLAIPPVGLLAYAAHVVMIYVYPNTSGAVAGLVSALDYVATTVAPYVVPVVLAVSLHPELRRMVLSAVPEQPVSAQPRS